MTKAHLVECCPCERIRNAGAAILVGMAVLVWGLAASAQQSVPIEADAIISNTEDFPRAKLLSLVKPGVAMIRARGWRCDSISSIQPFMFSRGFTFVCNRFNYRYEFRDRGGRWIVELK